MLQWDALGWDDGIDVHPSLMKFKVNTFGKSDVAGDAYTLHNVAFMLFSFCAIWSPANKISAIYSAARW